VSFTFDIQLQPTTLFVSRLAH